MQTRARGLVVVLLLLSSAAGAVVLAEERAWRHREGRSEDLQRLVGGLGFGPALDLSDCPFSFDPRLDGSCGLEHGSVPGGGCFCPRHSASLFCYPPLRQGAPQLVGEGDARSP
jgi:hypothetical protein